MEHLSYFGKTGVDNSTTVSTTATYLIKWVRSFYEWLSIISAILVIFFGYWWLSISKKLY